MGLSFFLFLLVGEEGDFLFLRLGPPLDFLLLYLFSLKWGSLS